MPAVNTNAAELVQNTTEETLEDYKKLNDKCEVVLEKIKVKRAKRKSKK